MAWKPDYVTLAEAKAFLRVTDTVDDVEIGLWITAASRAVDLVCNRQFGLESTPIARTYQRPPAYNPISGMWELEIDDLMTSTGLLVGGVAFVSSGCTLLDMNAAADQVPYQRIGYTYSPMTSSPGYSTSNVITAQWGWTAVPSAVKAAVRLQLNRWNARRDSPYGVAGSPDQGSEMRLLSRLDPDVSTTLGALRRRRRVG